MKHIGSEIDKLLHAKGVKKKDFAKMLEMTEQNLSKILKKDSIDAALLEKIAKTLNVSPIYFFDGNEDVPHNGALSQPPTIKNSFDGLADEEINQRLREQVKNEVAAMITAGELIPLSLHNEIVKEKEKSLLEAQRRIWELEENMQKETRPSAGLFHSVRFRVPVNYQGLFNHFDGIFYTFLNGLLNNCVRRGM